MCGVKLCLVFHGSGLAANVWICVGLRGSLFAALNFSGPSFWTYRRGLTNSNRVLGYIILLYSD